MQQHNNNNNKTNQTIRFRLQLISFILSLFLFEQQQFGVCLFEFRSFFLSFVYLFIYLFIILKLQNAQF